MPVDPVLRWVRAAALACAAWGTASAAHLAAGGRLPGPGAVLVLIGLVTWPLTLGLGRRMNRWRAIGLVLLAQAAMHILLVVLDALAQAQHVSFRTGSGPSWPGAGSGHAMAAMPAVMTGGPAGVGPMPHQTMSVVPGPGMMLAHVVAAGLLGLLLASLDRLLFSAGSLVIRATRPIRGGRLRLLRVLAVLLASLPRPQTAAIARTACQRDDVREIPVQYRADVLARRGPPTSVIAAAA